MPWFLTYMKPVFDSAQRICLATALIAAIEKGRDIDHRTLVEAFALRTQLVVQSGNEIYGHWTPWFDGGRRVDLGPFVLISSTAKIFLSDYF